jgi:hypothetical protein
MAAHRYWRIQVDAIPGDVVSVSELQMRSVAGGADLTVAGGPATASSVYDNDPATSGPLRAVDNNNATFAALAGPTGWFQYDFGTTPRDIVEITWRSRSDGFGEQSPTAGRVLFSDDGVTWTEYWRFKWALFGTGTTRTATRPAEATTARYWAIYGTSDLDVASASKITMSQTVGGADVCTGGAAFASSTYDNDTNYSPTRAFDTNNATLWASAENSPATHIGYARASGALVAVNQFTWRSRSDGFAEQAVYKGAVYYSPDGTSFLFAWAFNGRTYGIGDTQTFINPALVLTPRRRQGGLC